MKPDDMIGGTRLCVEEFCRLLAEGVRETNPFLFGSALRGGVLRLEARGLALKEACARLLDVTHDVAIHLVDEVTLTFELERDPVQVELKTGQFLGRHTTPLP